MPVRMAVCGATEWVATVTQQAVRNNLGDVVVVDAGADDPAEAQLRLEAALGVVDAILFDGRIHHDRLLAAHPDIEIPTLYLPVTRSMIYPTLIRAMRDERFDITRVSFDSVDDAMIRELYSAAGLPWQDVHTAHYQGLETTQRYIDFHQRLHVEGVTTGAITSGRVIVARLSELGIPVLKLSGPQRDHEEQLQAAVATLLGEVAPTRLDDNRLVVGEVAVARSTLVGDDPESAFWQQELGLDVHRLLLSEARALGGSVVAKGPLEFTVSLAMGDLRAGTNGFRVAPFLARIQSELGVVANAGFGVGNSTAEAAVNARLALSRAEEAAGCSAVVINADGAALTLPIGRAVEPTLPAPLDEFLTQLVSRIRDQRTDGDAKAMIVDRPTVATLMGLSEASARRRLDALVEHGRAWPMKSPSAAQGGRPRLHYRIIED